MAPTLRLPRLFTDHLVVQRDRPFPIWGWAGPGTTVTARLAGLSATTTTDPDGRFQLALPPQPAGGPHTLVISSSDGLTTTIIDVLVGEVWLCSGQSNMEWPTSASGYAPAEVNAAHHAQLRLFHVPQTAAEAVREDVPAQWAVCTPASLANFSGVAYAFARELMLRLEVPIGLIQSAWGGTAAEWWTPIEAMDAVPALKPIVDRHRSQGPLPKPGSPEHAQAMATWEATAFHQDPGNRGEEWGWHATELPTTEWQTMRLPQYWEATGLNIDGSVWFRRRQEIPASWVGKDLTLSLGPVDDFDVTYVNGVKVGGIGKETPNSFQVPRVYPVPGRLVSTTTVMVAVRVFDHLGNGGIYGHPSSMFLALATSPSDSLSMAGNWLYRVELALEPKPWTAPPATADGPGQPAVLWNGMLRPLAPYALKGVIWYQGESNADRAEQYRILMGTMITTWRAAWGYDFPFYQVQLAPFMTRQAFPLASAWAELREAQEQVTTDLPGCDLAVIIDSGDAVDIHPRNKPLVGRRLARLALAHDYGIDLEHSGPRLAGMERREDGLLLRFSHCAGGLVAFGGPPLSGFAIAGEDQRFVWAQATIDADTVLVKSPEVRSPVAVRYAWGDNPDATLMNQDNLPARPFRTDTWPGVTSGKR